ncbi:Hypothetical predicted protein [Octopus vulgaris]|uniref:Uncharacterized protein n=1 Tax=Octopus vulgaris TaxID=6645 RepID=A0AA36BBN5_OCTVU|nr:Hypothetical predicted protein [Octopus vulgaris]
MVFLVAAVVDVVLAAAAVEAKVIVVATVEVLAAVVSVIIVASEIAILAVLAAVVIRAVKLLVQVKLSYMQCICFCKFYNFSAIAGGSVGFVVSFVTVAVLFVAFVVGKDVSGGICDITHFIAVFTVVVALITFGVNVDDTVEIIVSALAAAVSNSVTGVYTPSLLQYYYTLIHIVLFTVC